MVQTQYLRVRVQPPTFYFMVTALLPTEFSLAIVGLISSGSGDNINLLGLDEGLADARTEVEALVASARHTACSANANQSGLRLLQAGKTFAEDFARSQLARQITIAQLERQSDRTATEAHAKMTAQKPRAKKNARRRDPLPCSNRSFPVVSSKRRS